jgi:hypothetical protein
MTKPDGLLRRQSGWAFLHQRRSSPFRDFGIGLFAGFVQFAAYADCNSEGK